MGFFTSLFRNSDNDDSDGLEEDHVSICETCENEVPEDELVDVYEEFDGRVVTEVCQGCSEHLGSTTSYCCGMIYEDGETVCASCGEPL